jgi:hypothetical protein
MLQICSSGNQRFVALISARFERRACGVSRNLAFERWELLLVVEQGGEPELRAPAVRRQPWLVGEPKFPQLH